MGNDPRLTDTRTPKSHTLSGHSDVSSTNPDEGQVLKWIDNEWAPAADDSGLSSISLSDITDINSLQTGHLLHYNGTCLLYTSPSPRD